MINLNDSFQDAFVKLSEGNPGALSALVGLMKHDPQLGFMRILDADDMGMKGPSIWLGYNNHCGQDIAKFAKALEDRDDAMIATIRRNGGQAWKGGKSCMTNACERLYHLTDAGVIGPAIENPLPLALLRDDPDTLLLLLTTAYNAGAVHGIGVCREATLTELERAVAASDWATDAKALDKLASDMGLDAPLVKLGQGDFEKTYPEVKP